MTVDDIDHETKTAKPFGHFGGFRFSKPPEVPTTSGCYVPMTSVEANQTLEPLEPFNIVLVDIHKTAAEGEIQCVKKRLEPSVDLKYIAISYRWGEFYETLVPTVDYDAHIVSFNPKDFIRLCQAISKEFDLQSMQYVWVDAICVDQANDARRKETIYHMNNIYEYANWILAVPDLHHTCLKKSTIYRNALGDLHKYNAYIYHSVMGNHDELEKLYDTWLEEELSVPKNLRRLLSESEIVYDSGLSSTRPNSGKEESERILFERLMVPKNVEATQLKKDTGYLNSPGSTDKDVRQKIREWQLDRKTGELQPGSRTRELQLGSTTRERHLQINTWQRAIDERQRKLDQVFQLFEDLVQVWSRRTWVISEYNIAKKKNNKVLKYWFTSLHPYCDSLDPSSCFYFFEIDLKLSFALPLNFCNRHVKTEQYYSVTFDTIHKGARFKYIFKNLIRSPRFLDILLKSKTLKNSDRFHAILPLSIKYRHHIKNKDTISGWQITDMISVRMRVRQWFTAKRNLHLVYEHKQQLDFGKVVSLPSFDVPEIELESETYEEYLDRLHDSERYNFDLVQKHPGLVLNDTIDQINGITETTGTSSLQLRYSMHLYPKIYRAKEISFRQNTSPYIRDNLWKALQMDPFVDPLVWVSIPLLLSLDYQSSEQNRTIERTETVYYLKAKFTVGNVLQLIGSRSKNVWIIISTESPLLGEKYIHSSGEWVWCQRSDGDASFRVF